MLGILIATLGIVMLFLGLELTNISPRLSRVSFTLPSSISRAFGLHKETREYSHVGSLITGALTFFVPCGFTQAMQLYAISTGSFTQGALIMFLFALGTTPGLLGIGGLTSSVKGTSARYFFKFSGLIVIILALINISSGMTLAGFTISSSTPSIITAPTNTELVDGKQVVRMEQSNGYTPNQFVVKKGVPVKWIINSTNPYTCASALVMPSMNISTRLHAGENVIEFTPTQVGQLTFSCIMGMFNGAFTVVE